MATDKLAGAILGGLFALTASGWSSDHAPPRNLLLVSLDTTRPDHLSAYGYERDTSPKLAEAARRGALFTHAFAQWTATGPSHASMLTGLYPYEHGFGLTRQRLRKRFPSLATALGKVGFRTGAFVSGFPLKGRLARGLERGFDLYDAEFKGIRRDGSLTVDATLEWLASGPPAQPYFAFVHLYDAHGPYTASGKYPRLFVSEERGPKLPRIPDSQVIRDPDGRPYRHLNDYVDHYDSGLVYQDSVLGRLLESVDLDRTLVIVTADHGESLGDHGGTTDLTHSSAVYDEQSRIPFVVVGPGIVPNSYDELVETVDILPTALELLAIPLPERLEAQGESLARLLRGERPERAGGIASTGTWPKYKQARAGQHVFDHPELLPLDGERVVFAARSHRWKLTLFPGVERDFEALYDLESDPGESVDVSGDYPEIRERLRERSAAWVTGTSEGIEELELTGEEIDKLRALGYVD